jgi:phosphoribosylaminoimidazole-succinocarboxamide synthase
MLSKEAVTAQLAHTLSRTDFPSLGEKYEGKVRDNYVRGDKRFIVVSDRVSAFDKVLGTIPFKGQLLNQLAAWWFEVTRDICENHLIETPDPQVTVARNLTPLPVELVVRAYLTGVTSTSIWTHYAQGKRVYAGHQLPEGMKKHQRLERPLVTPSTKAEKGAHDETISREEVLSRGLVSAADFDYIAEKALALFARGSEIAQKRGLILVDTKYEFGKDADGKIVLMDEIHTPDSSRYWYSRTYDDRMKQGGDPDALDKEFLRRYLVSVGYKGEGEPPPLPDDVRVEAALRYSQTFELLTGQEFTPEVGDPTARIRRNLKLSGAARVAKVFITPRKGLLDPQGEAVSRSLVGLGFPEVKGVLVGKYLEVAVEEPDRQRAEARVREMCQKLLANPIIEDFRIELDP